MKFLGLEISVRKAAYATVSDDYGRGWLPVVREPYAGAWQRNDEYRFKSPLQNSTLYRVINLIASDIAKMRLRLMAEGSEGVWQEATAPAFSPVLNKPNRFQNHIQFFEAWLISKLRTGNSYVLVDRDNRNVVTAMYVLDPARVRPLEAPDGAVFYRVGRDVLAGVEDDLDAVPASEIMHDRMCCLSHPLVGTPPLFAAAASAAHGLSIQDFSARFFTNAARPSGVLTAPGQINQTTADRLKTHWEENYTGAKMGRVAVLGDGLKFEPMQQNAVDSQLIEQLRQKNEDICTAYGVPGYMVGVQPPPNYNNAELIDLQYYKQCLQRHIHDIEAITTDGLGLANAGYRTEFDLTDLFRMDTKSTIDSLAVAVDKGLFTHNEARKLLGLLPQPFADKLMAQQQMFTLEALADRAVAPPLPASPQPAAPQPDAAAQQAQQAAKDALIEFRKGLANV